MAAKWTVLPDYGRLLSVHEIDTQMGFSEVLAVHAALLPTGSVLFFSGSQHDDPINPTNRTHDPSFYDHTRIWDPAQPGTVRTIPSPPEPPVRSPDEPVAYDVFCSGHAFLPDGRLLIAGGTSEYPPDDPIGAGPASFHYHHQHFAGVRHAAIFDPWNLDGPWSLAPDMHPEPSTDAAGEFRPQRSYLSGGGGRWYPTLVGLGDGTVVAAGGHPLGGDLSQGGDSRHSNYMVEAFRVHSARAGEGFPRLADHGHWEDLGDEPADVQSANLVIYGPPDPGPHPVPETYPRIHLLPSGHLLFVHLVDGSTWRWHPLQGGWERLCASPADFYDPAVPYYNRSFFSWTTVLLPLRPEDGYRARVLAVGREWPQILDLGEDHPVWRKTGSRDRSDPRLFDPSPHRDQRLGPDGSILTVGNQSGMRQNCLAVLLPDRTVFVTGGSTTSPVNSAGLDEDAVLLPEVYDDLGERQERLSEVLGRRPSGWRTIPIPANVPRIYHGVALLLADGRVWTCGSDHDSGLGDDARELRMEIFEPWYFSEDRPTISSAPQEINYGRPFTIEMADPVPIGRVCILRISSVTHGFHSDQRYVALEFGRRGLDLEAIAPPDSHIAPAGWYLLHIVDDAGVPSIGAFVHLVQPPMLPRAVDHEPTG